MKRMIGAALAALLFSAPAIAQTPSPAKVLGVYLGAHGVWQDGALANMVADVEAGANLRASLSPHISLVGSGYYGLDNKYLTTAGGLRITATDVKDRTFSIGVGIQYRWASKEEFGDKEWMPDVSVGWRPWDYPASRVVLIGQGAYGLTSERVRAILGVRYAIF